MTKIDRGQVIARTATHLETQLDDETIVMDTGSGQIYGMADTAQEIWSALREPIRFDALVDHMVARFAVTPALCGEEVANFLVGLQRAGMIEIRAGA
jgi:hypothetical protein